MHTFRLHITLLFAFAFSTALAQLESSFWYFGKNAGIDFSSGNPIAIYDGQLETIEGCATIADNEGNLLFYTDGIVVYNQNHQIMPNGDGLLGNPSSTQSAIIVPAPGNSNLYYIFTVSADDNLSVDSDGDGNPNDLQGLRYSLVDMNLDGGLGDVVSDSKNILLPLDENNPLNCSEKVSAVKHNNGNDVWVLTHFGNTFFAFLVDENGVNREPVSSTVGPLLRITGYPVNARGYLKLSPDGSRIAIAHLSLTDSGGNTFLSNTAPGYLGVYDFNNSNGVVSNEQVLNLDENGELNGSPYGIEFSPNNQYLYAELDFHNQTQWIDAQVIQYRIGSLPLERTTISLQDDFVDMGVGTNPIFRARGALQLALDGKIYMATVRFNPSSVINSNNGSSFSGYGGVALSVIHNPDDFGLASNYQHEAFQINSSANPDTFIAFGLPPFITSFFNIDIVVTGTLVGGNGCVGSTLEFSLNTNASDVVDVVWDFGDGTIVNSTNLDPIQHTYSAAGTYTVSSTATNSAGEQVNAQITIEIFDFPEVNNTSIVQCDLDGDGLASYDLTLANTEIVSNPTDFAITYHLSEEDANENQNPIDAIFTNTTPNQIVYARVENDNQCHALAEITLEVSSLRITEEPLSLCDLESDQTEVFDLSINQTEVLNNPEFSLDDEEYTLQYFESEQDAIEIVSPITNINNYTAPNYPFTIYVRVDSPNDCAGIVEFELQLLDLPMVNDVELVECDSNNDGLSNFDLTLANDQLVENPSDFVIGFYLNITDAMGNQNQLPLEYTNTQTNQIIFARVEDNNNCYSIAQIRLTTNPQPSIVVSDLVSCDYVLGMTINLQSKEAEILDNPVFDLEDSDYTIQYYESALDADQQNNPIADPTNFTNPNEINTIFVRLDSEFSCAGVAQFDLIFSEPIPAQNTNLTQCDADFDGQAVFDLTLAEIELINNPQDYTFDYFNSLQDAQDNSNALENPEIYTNINNQIFVRVQNNLGCVAFAEITLTTENQRIEITDALLGCDLDNNQLSTYNLTQKEQEILLNPVFTQPANTYQFIYFLNEQEAFLNQNQIQNPEVFSNTSNPQTIYVRIESGIDCAAIASFPLGIVQPPNFILNPEQVCPGVPVTINAPEGFLSYAWTGLQAVDQNQPINQNSITVSVSGTYTVWVQNNADCPPKDFSVEITVSNTPNVLEVQVNQNTANILANGDFAPFEFSIDNGQTWQLGSEFDNLPNNTYTVLVRNQLGCLGRANFLIFDVPNFISPNKDGQNDEWIIPGISNFNNTKISIYDRYGKMIHQKNIESNSNNLPNAASFNANFNNPKDVVWNGKYLGRPVPTTSYWYVIELETGEKQTGWLLVKNK